MDLSDKIGSVRNMKQREKLIVLRDRAELSQQALADLLDVSRQAVTRWESGTTVPTTDNLMSLAKLYGVSLDWLCSERGFEEQDAQQETQQENQVKTAKKASRKRIIVLAAIVVVVIGILIGIAHREKTNGTVDVSIDDVPGEVVNITDSYVFSLK